MNRRWYAFHARAPGDDARIEGELWVVGGNNGGFRRADFTLDGGVRWNWEHKDIDYRLEQSGGTLVTESHQHDDWRAPTGARRSASGPTDPPSAAAPPIADADLPVLTR